MDAVGVTGKNFVSPTLSGYQCGLISRTGLVYGGCCIIIHVPSAQHLNKTEALDYARVRITCSQKNIILHESLKRVSLFIDKRAEQRHNEQSF